MGTFTQESKTRVNVRVCKDCKLEKPLDDFYKYRDNRNGKTYHYTRCKPCHILITLPKTTEEKAARYTRDRKLRYKKIGGSQELFDDLNAKQNGLCAICGDLPHGTHLSMDHNHDTGVVRGLLCRSCNVGIGALQDKPELLERAARYLVEHAERAHSV